MVHTRYVYKNGKRYGPYYYHSYRDKDGSVKKHYIKDLKAIEGSGKLDFIWFFIGLATFGISALALVKLYIMPLI